MSEQTHRIFRLLLEIDLPTNEPPQPIQDRMSKLVNRQLQEVMEERFAQVCPAEERLFLDQLDLDLGVLALENWEEQLPLRLAEVLEEQLANLLLKAADGRAGIRREAIVGGSQLDILKFFLQKGAYPWWVKPASRLKPSQLLVETMAASAATFKQLLQQIGTKEQVRRRLVSTFAEPVLMQVVRVLEPGEFPFIEAFVQDIQQQHEEQPILDASPTRFRVAKWELVFQYLLVDRGSTFNQKSFIRQVLTGIALRFGSTYKHLLQELMELLEQIPPATAMQSGLPQIIKSLWSEEEKLEESDSDLDRPIWIGSTDQLLPFRQVGVESWRAAVRRLWAQDQAQVVQLIRQLVRAGGAGQEYLLHFPAEVVADYLKVYRRNIADHLLQLQEDLLWLGQKAAFAEWQAGALQQLLVQQYLLHLSGTAGQWYGRYKMLELIVYKLAGERGATITTWLQQSIENIQRLQLDRSFKTDVIYQLGVLLEEGEASRQWTVVSRQWSVGSEQHNSSSVIRHPKSVTRHPSPKTQTPQLPNSSTLKPPNPSTPQPLTSPLSSLPLQLFLTTEKLANNTSLASLSTALHQWLQASPLSFRIWLQPKLRDVALVNRLTTYWKDSDQRMILNVLEPPLGDLAGAIFQALQEVDILKPFTWSNKRFWMLVWQEWGSLLGRRWGFKEVVQGIVEALSKALQVSQDKLVEGLIEVTAEHEILWQQLQLLRLEWPVGRRPLVLASYLPKGEIAHTATAFWTWLEQSPSPFRKGELVPLLLQWMQTQPAQQIHQVWTRVVAQPALLQQVGALQDDRTLLQLMRQLNPRRVPQFLDIALTLKAWEDRQGGAGARYFPKGLVPLLLKGILTERGSLSNQKQFLTRLLRDWATAKGIAFKHLLRQLWPVVEALGPVFQDQLSLEVFVAVLQEHAAEPMQSRSRKKTTTVSKKKKMEEQKPYRKLWDRDPRQLHFQEVWLVPNAGMVLVWPYLNALFDRAGLMEDGVFLSEQAREKAVYLSEYLVRGEVGLEEYDLVLNKVLCGVPVEEPLSGVFELEEGWAELCEGLLQAVIQYWEALGDISPDALRETFLIRAGQLGQLEKGWHLKVEQASYDILLSQLPWGIGVVNLSWLEGTMEVEWR